MKENAPAALRPNNSSLCTGVEKSDFETFMACEEDGEDLSTKECASMQNSEL